MVFEQFHTTYQSDYTWPSVKNYGLKSKMKEMPREETGGNQPLLDPKLHPVKVGECPQSEISRFNQPEVFLEKLKQKFPYIYECLKTAACNGSLESRVNQDRLKTTYKHDYCESLSYQVDQDKHQRTSRDPRTQKRATCNREFTTKEHLLNRNIKKKSSNNNKNNTSYHDSPTGTTEYQDAISKLGNMIVRDKIHSNSQKC